VSIPVKLKKGRQREGGGWMTEQKDGGEAPAGTAIAKGDTIP